MVARGSLLLALLAGCNPDPSAKATEGVDFRPPGEDIQSGERGTISFSEILWSGSVNGSGVWDPTDVFVELRNEGSFPTNLSRWQIQMKGPIAKTWVLPEMAPVEVGDHVFIAAKSSGCFPAPDAIVPDLYFGSGDPFELTLRDADERLIEGAGDEEEPPFAGGWDGVRSRSMERVELMFGGEGSEPSGWHFYTPVTVEVPNDDRILADCVGHTLASPGRPSSPDYSGAFASGSFD